MFLWPLLHEPWAEPACSDEYVLLYSSPFLYQVMTSARKKGPASMAMFLVSSGADLTIVNTSNQTPLQLCADPNLIKLLERAQQEHKTKQTGTHTAHQSLHV